MKSSTEYREENNSDVQHWNLQYLTLCKIKSEEVHVN